jgi:ABC-type uncharacterized transport system permease subunit
VIGNSQKSKQVSVGSLAKKIEAHWVYLFVYTAVKGFLFIAWKTATGYSI